MKLFVYGTLRQRCYNNSLLQDSTLIKLDKIEGYKMRSCGFYPYVYPVTELPRERTYIVGELWEVENKLFKSLYDAEKTYKYTISYEKTESGLYCFIFTFPRDLYPGNPLVESGDWVEFRGGETK